MTDKAVLRKQIKAERAAMTVPDRATCSKKICEALLQLPFLRDARTVYCYAPLADEVDVWMVAEQMWAAGKRLAFPRVCDVPCNSTEMSGVSATAMDFFEVNGREELVEGAFHVMEPPDDGRVPVDWKGAPMLVPGVAFAPDGARCGYGKGYYDRYLARYPEHVCVGVAFDCQVRSELSAMCETTDQFMDYVQTECTCYDAADALSYEQMVEKISASRRFGRAPGIVCSRAVSGLLGHPERQMKFIHIAGTNGKGSVAAFLREICETAGLRVGMFTSPHLESFTERIQIGHEQIPQADLVRLGKVVIAANHRLMASAGINLTMFDYCLAIALLYYKEQMTDLVILETGMGGRLDSTNMIPTPLVSVITGIGLEHTEYLGDTIEAIAGEKAGILKTGTQAVLVDQDASALRVFTERCEELDIPYRVSGAVSETGHYEGTHYEIGMYGVYQRKNAAAAIVAADMLARSGMTMITPQAVYGGIHHARWQGRMEIVSEHPWLLLDGAHNVHGVKALTESLRAIGGEKTFTFFMGVMAEKDYETMVELTLPLAKKIYTMTPETDRALSAEKLCEMIRMKGVQAEVCEDAAHLLELVRSIPENEKCVVFGSLYLIGEIRQALLR